MIATRYLREIELRRDAVPSFNLYLFSLPAIRHLESLEFHPNVDRVLDNAPAAPVRRIRKPSKSK